MASTTVSTEKLLETTAAAVREHGIAAEILGTRAEALERIKALIPAGASVMTGASVSLKEIGFEDYLISGGHPWRNLKAGIVAETDPAKQQALRRQALLADYFLGSVHALVETGELVIASATGSQLGPYAFAASNVIWVVGSQKIVPSLDAAIARIKEHIMPHEELRMRAMTGGKMGTMLGKLMVIHREAPFLGRKLSLLLIREPTGD
ncbi:MAG TPA: lactate utilization protein [Rectinemataceae bacterium]|nr:lactate utilization protein [Rectinemataceae bacterium]